MTHRTLATLAILALAAALPASANDFELSARLKLGIDGNKGVTQSSGTAATGDQLYQSTGFDGPQKGAGLSVGYQLLRQGNFRLTPWIGYDFALGSPAFVNQASNLNVPTPSRNFVENVQGTVKSDAMRAGLTLAWATRQVGEYGFDLEARRTNTQFSGQLAMNGAAAGGYSVSSAGTEGWLDLFAAYVTPRPTYKIVQRISYGISLASAPSLGLGPGVSQFAQSPATFLKYARPTSELSYQLGFRF